MEEERIVTETERRIYKKRMGKKITPDKVFSLCGVQALSNVYDDCGGRGVILYFTLLGNSTAVGKNENFSLYRNALEATGFNKSQLSQATLKLEQAGYITVTRKSGHKNLFALTPKGRKGLVSRK